MFYHTWLRHLTQMQAHQNHAEERRSKRGTDSKHLPYYFTYWVRHMTKMYTGTMQKKAVCKGEGSTSLYLFDKVIHFLKICGCSQAWW